MGSGGDFAAVCGQVGNGKVAEEMNGGGDFVSVSGQGGTDKVGEELGGGGDFAGAKRDGCDDEVDEDAEEPAWTTPAFAMETNCLLFHDARQLPRH